MPQVQRSCDPSFSGLHNEDAMMPGGGHLFSDELSGAGLATSGPWSGIWHQHCRAGAGSQQSASIALQLLGLVAGAKTPKDKAALISAAISLLKNGTAHGHHHDTDNVLKTLSGLAQQISTSPGLSKSAKDLILDGIAKLAKQIASSAQRQHGTSNGILHSLNQLIDRISHARGLDQATKNRILDQLAGIVQQLEHSGSGSSGCSHAGRNACDVGNDNAATSGDADAA